MSNRKTSQSSCPHNQILVSKELERCTDKISDHILSADLPFYNACSLETIVCIFLLIQKNPPSQRGICLTNICACHFVVKYVAVLLCKLPQFTCLMIIVAKKDCIMSFLINLKI